jgi:acetolactate synthase-1/3 small subunit
MQILDRFGARILEDTKESMVVEVTGSEEGIDDFIQALRPHGILELTRTGRIAMIRGLPAQRAAAADAPGLYNPKVREEASTL